MTINDLKIDIISVVSQVTDMSVLSKIRTSIRQEVGQDKNERSATWKGGDTKIRTGVTFGDLIREQNYTKVSFDEFTRLSLDDEWEVSLDELLEHSN